MIDMAPTIYINHESWQWQTTQTKFFVMLPQSILQTMCNQTYSGAFPDTPHNPFQDLLPTHSRAFLTKPD